MAVLEITKLNKEFEGLKVLDNINFSVEEGELVVLFGPNGCGKTTILKLIAGLLKPTSGEITLQKRNNRRIGFIFQEDRLFPWKTVYENLDIVSENFFVNKIEREEKIKKYLNLVGLWNFKEYYPNKLSGGMKQKISLARALVIEPEIVLMDEPFSSFDVYDRERLQKETLRIWKETNKSIVFVTHNIDEALTMGQKIILLSERPSRVLKILTGKNQKDLITKELKNIMFNSEKK